MISLAVITHDYDKVDYDYDNVDGDDNETNEVTEMGIATAMPTDSGTDAMNSTNTSTANRRDGYRHGFEDGHDCTATDINIINIPRIKDNEGKTANYNRTTNSTAISP